MSGHWSRQKEEGGARRLRLFLVLFALLPPLFLSLLAYPVAFCYFLASKKAREASGGFLDQAFRFRGGGKKPSRLRHITAFALALVEKAEAWGGRIPFRRIHFQDDDSSDLINRLENGNGAALLCSHLGNAELLRALADYRRTGVSREVPVTAVVDFEVTPFFNAMLEKLNPRSLLKIVNANAICPASAIALKEEIERGGLAVIAGDRTPARSGARRFFIPFLGKETAFPSGPYLLAAVLEAPVYAVFALRRRDLSPLPDYDMHVRLLSVPPGGNRSRREHEAAAEELASRFVALLESRCLQHPHQWYNFYDLWAEEPETDGKPNDQS